MMPKILLNFHRLPLYRKGDVSKVMVQYVLIFGLSAILAGILTWTVRHIATRHNLTMAVPSSRHIHARPIPRLGGVAVFATFAAVFGAYLVATRRGWEVGPLSFDLTRIFLIGVAFFAAGLVDDLRGLGPWTKLFVEIGGGVALYFSGIHFGICGHSLPLLIGQGVCLSATILWVVLICNAVNLIDGIDGLAAGAALFSMVTIFSFAVGSSSGVATVTVILAGSLVGFLAFNFSPASIFLGDGGSLFVGFMLSGFVLTESARQQTVLNTIFVPLVCFALPLTEVAVSVLRRFLSGRSLFGADREHIHHKLLEMGLTQRQAVGVLYCVSALCTLLSLALLSSSERIVILIGGILLLLLFFGIRQLGYEEFEEFGRVVKSSVQQREVFVRNIAIRKAAASMESSGDLGELVRTLEECLAEDFDAFEIILDESFTVGAPLPSPWHQGAVSRCWRSSEEELCLTMGLYGEAGQSIGKISLYQSARNPLFIDTDLLKGLFRISVATALQNALGSKSIASSSLERSRSSRGVPQWQP